MSGTTGKTTTQTANSDPWGPSQPYLKNSMAEADTLFNAGIGSQTYTGSTVTPFANQTMQSMNGMQNAANQSAGIMGSPLNAYSSLMPGAQQMAGGNFSGTPYGDAISQYAKLSGSAMPAAMGDFSNDIAFNKVLSAGQDAAHNAVNMDASGMGRYGSAVHQGNVAREVGDFTNRSMLQAQQQAANQVGQFGGLATNTAQGGQNFGMNSVMGLGAGMPGAYDASMQPYGTLAQIGQNYENKAGEMKRDELRIFDSMQQKPWDSLAQYNALMSGGGKMGGDQTQTSSTPGTPWWQQGLGFGLSALTGGLF